MKNQNQSPVEKMRELDSKICGQIKAIQENSQMVEAGKKLTELRDELKIIEKKLAGFYGQPFEAEKISSPEKDAQALLDGISITGLPGQSKDTILQNLRRGQVALETAIRMQQEKIRELNSRLICEGCKELEPVAKKYIKATIAAFEQVKNALQEQEIFFQFLAHKGLAANLRPTGWQTTDFEKVILFGGAANLCSLDFWLELRRKTWKLDGKK